MIGKWLRLNSLVQLGRWAQMMIARLRSDMRAAHQRSVRKSIWKNKKAQRQPHENFLMQLSSIDLGGEYSLGIASVDNHHRIIALMFNGLVKEVAGSNPLGQDMQDIFHRLSVLISAIGEHFLDEEREMAAHMYPRRFLHKKQHDEFLVDVMMLMDSLKHEDYGIEEFIFFIGSWWSGHILISDKYFGEFLDHQKKVSVMTSSVRVSARRL